MGNQRQQMGWGEPKPWYWEWKKERGVCIRHLPRVKGCKQTSSECFRSLTFTLKTLHNSHTCFCWELKARVSAFESLFIFENEDWQIIISHQLNPQNTSWWPLHGDLEQTTESVDDGVCCWLSLTPDSVGCHSQLECYYLPADTSCLSSFARKDRGSHLSSEWWAKKLTTMKSANLSVRASLPTISVIHPVSLSCQEVLWHEYLPS